MFAERTQREDVVHFLNSAFACTGQREFYENAHSQRVSIDFLHQYMLVNYRSVYCRSLAVGINHFNQSQVILRLLASGKQALPGEGRLTQAGWSPLGNSAVLSKSDRSARIYDLASGQLRSSVIADGKQVVVVSAAGHYRVADEPACELVYVVQTAKSQETLSTKDFTAKYRFRNNPAAVVLMDR